MIYNMQAAAELRKAVQIFLGNLDPDTDTASMLEVPTMFPAWEVGKAYKAKDVFSYGTNAVGDPQLYQVLQAVTAEEHFPPDTSISLYKAIGVTEEGYAVWVQPLGATDAYNTGDVVSHNGTLWVSAVDANVWVPGVFGWDPYTA